MIKKILVIVIILSVLLVGCRLPSEPSLRGDLAEESASDAVIIDQSTEREVGNITGDINDINAELDESLAELDSLDDLNFEL